MIKCLVRGLSRVNCLDIKFAKLKKLCDEREWAIDSVLGISDMFNCFFAVKKLDEKVLGNVSLILCKRCKIKMKKKIKYVTCSKHLEIHFSIQPSFPK